MALDPSNLRICLAKLDQVRAEFAAADWPKTPPEGLLATCQLSMASCPHCGGPLTIIAAIENPTVMAKILTHLGLPTRALPRSPARTGELLQTA